MDSVEEPTEESTSEAVETAPVDESPIETGAISPLDEIINEAELSPVEPVEEIPPDVLPETEEVSIAGEKVEEVLPELVETPQSDLQPTPSDSPAPADSPALDEKTEKRGKKVREGKGKNKKKVEEELESPNDVGQQVDFDGPRKDPRHSHNDMTSDDLKVALQFYGTMDREFLHNLLLNHFEDRELENLFCDVLDTEGEEVFATSRYVKKGTLNFDELNQRFIGVPAACASETPYEYHKLF